MKNIHILDLSLKRMDSRYQNYRRRLNSVSNSVITKNRKNQFWFYPAGDETWTNLLRQKYLHHMESLHKVLPIWQYNCQVGTFYELGDRDKVWDSKIEIWLVWISNSNFYQFEIDECLQPMNRSFIQFLQRRQWLLQWVVSAQ